jgi:adenylosuccinate lyase
MLYQSPFSTRYGSEEMRSLWSELARRRTWRRIWLAVAEVQASAGLVTPQQIEDLRAHLDTIDLDRAATLEMEIGHDLAAELRTFAEQCPLGGAILHWGLTSADIQDNGDIARQRAALAILLARLRDVLLALSDRIVASADLPILAYTHLQPAEPTTLGYRLASYAQDLLGHFDSLARLRMQLKGKGIRGSVGTAAPFVEMLHGTGVTPETLEASVMRVLGIEAHAVVTQTYPRVQDYALMSTLAALAASLHKFASDVRLMQSPGMASASEPFGAWQVGSSAMPFKRNPVQAEQICSLARLVISATVTAWDNAAEALLERTLDDSANRRTVIPESFLACDQMLLRAKEIVEGLVVDEARATALLDAHGPFAATERILSALVRAGADRQEMHERLRQHALQAWDAVRAGRPNPLASSLVTDTTLLRYLQPARLRELLEVRTYTGLAPERARTLARAIRQRLGRAEGT